MGAKYLERRKKKRKRKDKLLFIFLCTFNGNNILYLNEKIKRNKRIIEKKEKRKRKKRER